MLDVKTNLLWLAKYSAKIKKVIEKREHYGRLNDKIKIVTVQDRKSVLLLQNMYPVAEKYVSSQYIREGQAVKIGNESIMDNTIFAFLR